MNNLQSDFHAKAEKCLSKNQLSLVMGFFRTVTESLEAEVRQTRLSLANNQHIVKQLELACKQRDDMSAIMVQVNEYCQQNNVGVIGDSACLSLVRDHKVITLYAAGLQGALLDLADAVLASHPDLHVNSLKIIQTLRPEVRPE
jgi:hypothetical protein